MRRMKTIISHLPSPDRFKMGIGSVEIGYPWLTYGAIIELELLVNKDFKVIEFGSGGSTIFFARRCGRVKSFENKARWYNHVKSSLDTFPNVELVFGSTNQIIEMIGKEPRNFYDLALVDNGPDYRSRRKILNNVPGIIRDRGYLVVDNYTYSPLDSFDYSGFEIYNYDAIDYIGTGTRICIKKN